MLGELATKAVATGEALKDFSYKTSISVENASALQYAADVAGTSLDTMGNAIFMMQRRMADDSTGNFAAALDKIGLSIQDIEGLDPDQQFLRIASAFKENTNATDRASVAMALFGRGGREIVPAMMKDLGDLTDQAKQLGHVMSGETAQGLEDLGMSWRALKEGVAWTGTEVGVGVVHFFQDLTSGINQALFVLDPFSQDMKILGDRIAGALPAVKELPGWMGQIAAANKGVAMATYEADAASKELDDDTKAHIDQMHKQQDAIDGIVRSLTGYHDGTKDIAALTIVANQGLVNGTDTANRFADAVQKLHEQGVPVPPILDALAKSARDAQSALDTAGAMMKLQNQEFIDMEDHLTSLLPVAKNFFDLMHGMTDEFDFTDDAGRHWPKTRFDQDDFQVQYVGPNQYSVELKMASCL